MELYFCDLCQEAVPRSDIDSKKAFVNDDRVVCVSCNTAMGGKLLPEMKANSGAPRRPRALITPGIGAALASVSIVLTIVAVVSLLYRVEGLSHSIREEIAAVDTRIEKVHQRQLGTREGMVGGAKRIAEDAVYAELKRFDEFERHLGELREALGEGQVEQNGGDLEASAPVEIELLFSAGDMVSKIDDVEKELLFLQARVFEILEEDLAEAKGETPILEKTLIPSANVGQLVIQLKSEDPVERVTALFALAVVEEQGVVRHITPLLEDQDAYIRTLSARILESMNARSAVQDLIELLNDTDAGARESAISALRAITSQQFAFDPRGPGTERFAGVKRWEEWWSLNWKGFLYSEE
ncbi:MAG: hypothetical protein ACI8X5_000271 [Planctomycetota bacterium]|jgi:hypothetical protein